ncbi:MAG: 1,4-alpha-glucan branching protein GlgB [Thermoplasmata archaeon]
MTPRTRSVGSQTTPARGESSHTSLSDLDVYLFNEGTHLRLYERMGAHPAGDAPSDGTYFAVWAPNAERVSVIGEFNGWTPGADPLEVRGSSGIFEGTVPSARRGALYKYRIDSRYAGYRVDKADPFGFLHEQPPGTASRVWDLEYEWNDARWMAERGERFQLEAPVSIYEVHLGSWRRVPEEKDRSLTFREAAPLLAEYVPRMGFTHVEFLPLMEHPFYGSWGYEPIGLFAPTARYGTPQDLMELVNTLHRAGVGVIFDWVPSHFPRDEHGLAYFDGTHLFEHADPRRGYHPDWNTFLYNYGRHEIRSFLGSSASFWLDQYHGDGIRVDGVASMLYLDYSRAPGEWIANNEGGRENLDAIRFLRWLNESLYRQFPGTQTVAEESTAWPMVSRPTTMGGLGFGYKWDMGWMHDSLAYFGQDPIHRRWHHGELTFRMIYAYHENFILPLSHDEVVYGKGSLLQKMPGDLWQRLANLRLLYGYMYALPGKKLLFMGDEFGQEREWNHDQSLDWHLVGTPQHAGVQAWVRRLNEIYRSTPALYERDYDPNGFAWVEPNDANQSVLSLARRGADPQDPVLVVLNFTPVPRSAFRIGAPLPGSWEILANSDATEFGGSGAGTSGRVDSTQTPLHGWPQSVVLDLPPLGVLLLRPAR